MTGALIFGIGFLLFFIGFMQSVFTSNFFVALLICGGLTLMIISVIVTKNGY